MMSGLDETMDSPNYDTCLKKIVYKRMAQVIKSGQRLKYALRFSLPGPCQPMRGVAVTINC